MEVRFGRYLRDSAWLWAPGCRPWSAAACSAPQALKVATVGSDMHPFLWFEHWGVRLDGQDAATALGM